MMHMMLPTPNNRMTDSYENIILSQLLSPAVIQTFQFLVNFISQQECIPVGCVPSAAIRGGVCAGVSAWGGCLPRGCLPWGVYAQGVSARGVCIPACTAADTPLWTQFLTHTCKNITFPQADGNYFGFLSWLKLTVRLVI